MCVPTAAGYNADMTPLKQVIRTLRSQEQELRARGISHAALFGSVARGDSSPASDIDLLVDLDPSRQLSIFDFIGIKHFLDDTFGRQVDLVSRHGVSAYVLPAIERDLIRVF
jgi:uncharacterized protein